VFMGTPDFAVGVLDAIHKAGVQVVGVVTAPDKPAGRGKKLRASAVKEYTLANLECPLLQPEKLKAPEVAEELRALEADIFIVVAFRMLPEVVWSIPSMGTINLHASLLPQYRGAAPINWAVINGETETGVTSFLIDKEIDTGKVLLQEKVAISNTDSAGTLHDKLMDTGAALIVRTIQERINNTIEAVAQEELSIPEAELKKAPKIFKDDCRIDWNKSGAEIYNLVRGMSPFPTAFTMLQQEGKEDIQVKLFEGKFEAAEHTLEIGRLVSEAKNELKVAIKDGYYHIKSLQLAGKKRMASGDFLRGFQDISMCIVS